MFQKLMSMMGQQQMQEIELTGKKGKLLAILHRLNNQLPIQFQIFFIKYNQQLCHKINELSDEQIDHYVNLFIVEAKAMIETLEGEMANE